MGIESIVADAEGTLTGIASVFGFDTGTKYPKELGEKVSNVIDENDKNWRKSRGFVFQVVRVKNGEIVAEPPTFGEDADGAASLGGLISNGSNAWLPFTLQINPQDLQQDEIFAIEVTPTFNGVLVEHQGTTLKDIVISGTTGISPGRKEGGAFPQTGRPVFAAGHSGYKEFHELRSYFRAYVEQKRSDPDRDNKGELRMVWRNLKDHEDLFVEPQRFTMKRSATKPFMYDYVINMKAIGKAVGVPTETNYLALIDEGIEDALDALQTVSQLIQGAFGFVKSIQSDLGSVILSASNSYAAAIMAYNTGVANAKSFDEFKENLTNTINANLNVAKSISSNPAKTNDLQNAKSLELSEQLAANVGVFSGIASKLNALLQQSLIDNAYNVIEASMTKSQAAQDQGSLVLVPGINGTSVLKSTLDAKNLAAADYEKITVLKGIMKANIAFNKILQNNTLFLNDKEVDPDTGVNSYYDNAKANAALSATLASLKKAEASYKSAKQANDAIAISVAKLKLDKIKSTIAAAKTAAKDSKAVSTGKKIAAPVTIAANDTIQVIAAKQLGNPNLFKELAFFNKLIPPYIDTAPIDETHPRVPGVLRPGDKIYVPKSGAPTSGGSGTVSKNDKAPIVANLSQAEKNFGCDFQLTDDFDLAISNTGDLKLVAGVQNIVQRIVMKLMLEPGSLKQHPQVGVGLQIGEKVKDDPQVLLDRIRRSLANDTAISTVLFAEVLQENSIIRINLVLKLKNQDQPISVPIKVA